MLTDAGEPEYYREAITDAREPEYYQEAISGEHKKEWLAAMREEMKSLHENHTFDLINLLSGKKASFIE